MRTWTWNDAVHAYRKEMDAAGWFDFQGVNLSGAQNLSGLDLSGCNFAMGDLHMTDLSWSNLSESDLCGANLFRSDLSRSDLYKANLSGANLSKSNLCMANLTLADLYEANLYEASYGPGIPITREPLQIHGLRWTVIIMDHHIKIGCKIHSTEEWVCFDDAFLEEMDEDAMEFKSTYKTAILELAYAHQRRQNRK